MTVLIQRAFYSHFKIGMVFSTFNANIWIIFPFVYAASMYIRLKEIRNIFGISPISCINLNSIKEEKLVIWLSIDLIIVVFRILWHYLKSQPIIFTCTEKYSCIHTRETSDEETQSEKSTKNMTTTKNKTTVKSTHDNSYPSLLCYLYHLLRWPMLASTKMKRNERTNEKAIYACYVHDVAVNVCKCVCVRGRESVCVYVSSYVVQEARHEAQVTLSEYRSRVKPSIYKMEWIC